MRARGAEKPRRLRHQQTRCRPNPRRGCLQLSSWVTASLRQKEKMGRTKSTTWRGKSGVLFVREPNLTTPIFSKEGAHLHRRGLTKFEERRGAARWATFDLHARTWPALSWEVVRNSWGGGERSYSEIDGTAKWKRRRGSKLERPATLVRWAADLDDLYKQAQFAPTSSHRMPVHLDSAYRFVIRPSLRRGANVLWVLWCKAPPCGTTGEAVTVISRRHL